MAQSDLSQQQQDEALLQKFGYKQELRRSLGFISNFAVAFSYISVSTGTFSLFALGILAGGPAFYWTWFIVAIGQFIVALNFAELASHFPIAGSIYQWSKRLSGFTLGWFTGWFYFFAGVLTITGVAYTIPIPLLAILANSGVAIPTTILGLNTSVFIALCAIVIGTIINIAGVRLLSIINNIGVAAEIIGMFVFALVLLIFFNHQSLGFLFTGPTAQVSQQALGGQWTPPLGDVYIGAFAAAMFMSLFVIYGFDTAGTLGEETRDPQRNAPRGVLWAIGLSAIAGILFLGGTILSIKDLPRIENIAVGANPNIPATATLPTIITDALGTNWGNIYLGVVLIAVCVCTLAIQSATIRLMFSMGRDGRLPFGRVWGTVNPTFRTPIWSGIAVGILSAIPLVALKDLPNSIAVIVVSATGLIYVSYFLNNIASLGARMRGWPSTPAPFSLGSWGKLVNILALVYGGAMIINFLWFGGLRNTFAINPNLSTAFPSVTNPLFANIPLFELTLAILFVVGAIYWFGFKRRAVIAGGEKRAEALSD